MTCLLVLSIFIFVSSHRLMRWTPLMTWLLVATMVWLEASISVSLNPTLWTGFSYLVLARPVALLVAPPLGTLLAVGAFRLTFDDANF